MTSKLYYQSAYLQEWHTSITQTIEREDGVYVLLEETAFYPHGGGQPCDQGNISGIPVLDVSLEGDNVLHKLERLPEGTEVSCQLNWQVRFDHMQQHSGQHLLSAVCRDLYEANTVSFHLGTDYCTIDVESTDLDAGKLAVIEAEVNRQIYLNRAITSYFVSPEELAQLPIVKQPKVTNNIRIVEIEGVEYNACGGTHVSATGEIGIIKLLKTEKMKGNTRIYFACGARAVAQFNEHMRIIGTLSAKYNTGKDEIMDRVEKWEQEYKQTQQELAELRTKYDNYVAKELITGSTGIVTQQFEDLSMKDMQGLANTLASQTDLPILLVTTSENKVIFTHSGQFPQACGAFFKAHLSTYQGKGGGSDKMAQAGFADQSAALAFYTFAKEALKGN
ncbi:alanyl-tRNA editing protein [Paenibacillus roseipurpureus]|uniref:Alanyl-tRNA editing protein n=1 Tax=Paenibacillus roseopurpureus TaxID=2918901 RepID=A0AA96RGE3_9BACL|nr:alanyl-tRNA editing protein [Paenibacillus sp. MBLB1832]WNR42093.1 alanyl-tRNA editing protein [Paenibacillus sp. MBLB1832]